MKIHNLVIVSVGIMIIGVAFRQVPFAFPILSLVCLSYINGWFILYIEEREIKLPIKLVLVIKEGFLFSIKNITPILVLVFIIYYVTDYRIAFAVSSLLYSMFFLTFLNYTVLGRDPEKVFSIRLVKREVLVGKVWLAGFFGLLVVPLFFLVINYTGIYYPIFFPIIYSFVLFVQINYVEESIQKIVSSFEYKEENVLFDLFFWR